MEQSDNVLSDKTIFPDLPSGPLTKYRKLASFDWRKLALCIETEKARRLKYKIWKFYENHPEFARPTKQLTLDETRHRSTRQQYVGYNEKFFTLENQVSDPDLILPYHTANYAYDVCFCAKMSLGFGMFPMVLRSSGTERLLKYVEDCEKGLICGSFALTEIAHGSNTMRMRTTATYDRETKEFIINTPDFEAAKCWIGNLGKTCTHTIVYAQLYTHDGKHCGLHAFLIQVRDTKRLLPLSGIIVGDIGEKIGMNGVDNGFIMFDNYRIPKENLLARSGDINDDGQYISNIKSKRDKLGASFGALSTGRVSICGMATANLLSAIVIALRYSVSRRQFGPENSTEEYSVIEYQAQQYRLLPHLATTIVQKVFSEWLSRENAINVINSFIGENTGVNGMEIHALSSAGKAVCAWAARDGIQDCREACGGHGYLKVSRLGTLRDDNDGNCTYEGENNVLIQQASNWLLNVKKSGCENFANVSPYGSVAFLKDFNVLIKEKFNFKSIEEAIEPKNILSALNWLCAWLLEQTSIKMESLQNENKSIFDVRNDMQVFYASNLSIAYAQRSIFYVFLNHITNKLTNHGPEYLILTKILSLYGTQIIIKHLTSFFEGGYIMDSKSAQFYKNGILKLLTELKNEAIAIVDAIAPTDFIINSPLGMSDGDVYKHLKHYLYTNESTFDRPEWWKDVIYWENYVKSKL